MTKAFRILYELTLKSGLFLTADVEKGKAGKGSVCSVDGDALLVFVDDPLSRPTLRAMIELTLRRVLCLEQALRGNDHLKSNIVLEMRSHGIEFRTV